MMDSFSLAIWLHDNYEDVARQSGWDTQDKCKVGFHDLPEKNKITMIELAIRLNKKFRMRLKQ